MDYFGDFNATGEGGIHDESPGMFEPMDISGEPSTSGILLGDPGQDICASTFESVMLEDSPSPEMVLPRSTPVKSIRITFDPVVMHTIALMKYRKRMASLSIPSDRLGLIPEQTEKKPPLLSPSSMHLDPLTDDVAEDLIRKSIILIAAHIGFDGVEESMVNLLSRITMSRLEKTWKTMRICDERRQAGREAAFTCSFLQTLRILRIEDVKDIRDFYLRRIGLRRDSLLTLCEKERLQFLRNSDEAQQREDRTRDYSNHKTDVVRGAKKRKAYDQQP